MTTIPASDIVNVTPSVLAAGGNALDLNGLLLSTSSRVPIGSVQSFASAAAVSAFFGATSTEADLADIYFGGFDNSPAKPGALLIAQYPMNAVGAYLRGASVATLTVAQLQALSGLLALTIDGSLKSATISLAAATSFSNAASIIGSALSIQGPQAAVIHGSIAGGTLTVGTLTSGSLAVGDVLSGGSVTAGTYVTALLTGTGGAGTYSVSPSQVASAALLTAYAPAVTYDSTSGGFIIASATTGSGSTITYGSGALSSSLKLTLVTGAVISQGAGAAVPATFMDALINVTQNWALFTTAFDPDTSGNTNKLAFAAWTDDQNQRYGYAAWDTDASPTVTVPATSSLGYLVGPDGNDYAGTSVIYSPDASLGVFELAIAASIDFERLNGRTTFAFRSQSGLSASVTDQTVAANLLANNYNFYGAYASANDGFVFLYDGSVSGDFAWLDSYVNQIWLNNAFQLALMNLLTNALSIPYNAAGNAQIEAALADPINAGLNFGAYRAGVALSASQIASVNAQAGVDVATTIQQRGWALQVLPASPTVRAARGSPPCTFWYADGQAVQSIDLSSVALT